MSVFSKLTKAAVTAAVGLTLASSSMVAQAADKVTTIRVQSVISAKADEVTMLKRLRSRCI